MANAPVCHIPPEDANIPQPGIKTLPAIPPATDLKSALAAIGALTQTIRIITNQIDTNGQNGQLNNFNTRPDPNNKKPQWVERSRVEDTVKIYQNNDPSTGNFVEVKQINSLTMVDRATGNSWTWDRQRK